PSGTPRASTTKPESTNGRHAPARRAAAPRATGELVQPAPASTAAPQDASADRGPHAAPTAPAVPAAAPVQTSHANAHDDPLAALLDEAQAAVSGGANALRDVRERYRSAYLEKVERWEA